MTHHIPIESNFKNEPPPPPEDDRNIKKAKLGDNPDTDETMEIAYSSPLIVKETQVSEFVPETQYVTEGQTIVNADDMNVDKEFSDKSIPSFKDMLLNTNKEVAEEEEEEEVILRQGDVTIGMNGNIPTVNFATHVLEVLNKRMGFAVVVKLLGRIIGYRQLRLQLQNIWRPTGRFQLTDLDEDCFLVKFKDEMDFQNALINGPWLVFGHYLTVSPWSPSFKPQDHKINQVVARKKWSIKRGCRRKTP